jgi:hypothetical protein
MEMARKETGMSKSADETNEEAQALLGMAGLAPEGSMAEAVGGMHEAYLSFVDGGFSPRQALWLIGTMVSIHGPGTPPEPDAK